MAVVMVIADYHIDTWSKPNFEVRQTIVDRVRYTVIGVDGDSDKYWQVVAMEPRVPRNRWR